jgi:hypothetical protein
MVNHACVALCVPLNSRKGLVSVSCTSCNECGAGDGEGVYVCGLCGLVLGCAWYLKGKQTVIVMRLPMTGMRVRVWNAVGLNDLG